MLLSGIQFQRWLRLVGNYGLKNQFGVTANSFPSSHPVTMSLIYMVIIMVIFVPLSVRKYSTTANR